MSLNHSPKIVTDGLVLCLDAASRKSYPGSGTTWFDRSGRGNNATLRNWSSPSTTIRSNVKCFNIISTAAGTGDMEIPNFYTNYHAGINTFTFEWWANASSTGFDAFNSGGCGNGTCIAYSEDGDYYDSTGGKPVNVGILFSSWNQYVLVQNGSVATSYRNGIQISTRSDWITPVASNRSGIIGSRSWSNRTNNWFLANLKWYNRSMPISEIKQNFNVTKSRFGL